MRYILRVLSSRIFNLVLLLIIQIMLLTMFVLLVSKFKIIPTIISYIINFIILLIVINRKDNPSYRLLWTMLILLVPYVGGIIYIIFGDKKAPKSLTNINIISLYNNNILKHKYKINDKDNIDKTISKQFNYIQENIKYPYYKNTNTKYYNDGESVFKDIIEDLKNAKHYIFIEFFIVDNGYLLDTILDILKEKVKENVLVYFMYDDAGCVTTLSRYYYKKLRSYGIKCEVFNKLKPRLEINMNNRNHRKLIVIDNQIGYMGGFNLADEYINKKVKYGYWKDNGIKLTGEAVYSMTVMFIQFYNAITKDSKIDYNKFNIPTNIISNDIVCPFSDSPTDIEDVGHNVHINLINNATKYIYIHTPYLILDYTMTQSLILAAKNGIDVIITTPHIPDKKFVFELTRYNYLTLLENGVKIYEFTPGFLHSKTIVCDDNIALIGTINMDYRSYFLHYECGVLITSPNTIKTIKQDYIDTLNKSQQITIQQCKNIGILRRIYRAILNVISPLI